MDGLLLDKVDDIEAATEFNFGVELKNYYFLSKFM